MSRYRYNNDRWQNMEENFMDRRGGNNVRCESHSQADADYDWSCRREGGYRPSRYGKYNARGSSFVRRVSRYRGRGRDNRRERWNIHSERESNTEATSSNRSKHPSWLKGRAIGMWYAQRSKASTEIMNKAPELSMATQEAEALNEALDGLISPIKEDEKKSKSSEECQQQIVRPLSRKNLDKQFHSCDKSDKLNEPNNKKQKKNETITQRLKKIDESDFKRAYQANVEGNQMPERGTAISASTFPVFEKIPELDQNMYDELLLKESSKRYLNMLEIRKKLPSYDKKEDILNSVLNNQVVVLSGETGCGKTTQVAQFILDYYLKKKEGSTCRIVCTQPRRISAISVAKRVAEERAESLGKSVGYQIRLDSVMPRKKGSILYCTTGIILQWLISDHLLSTTSHLILDEIHERDTISDFLICIARDLLPLRPDLKLILMSATLNAEKFSRYYGGCPMVHIPGFTYDVKEYYLEDVVELTNYRFSDAADRYGNQRFVRRGQREASAQEFQHMVEPYLSQLKEGNRCSAATVKELSKPVSEDLNLDLILKLLHFISVQPPGAILIFLPGWENISKLNRMIEGDSFFETNKFRVIPLHSMMPTVNQREVFHKPPSGVRKIVIATNIAETSITIDDVVYVVDCGKIKMKNYDKDSNISTLLPEWVTLANAIQRRGRAGRVQEGICYHLYTKAREKTLKDFPLPEMQRTRLEEVILQVKILKLGFCKPFLSRVMDPPEDDVIDTSVKMLQAINALDDNENLTPLGFHLAQLPMDPLTGKMLLMGAIFSCLNPVLTVAASLSFKDPFSIPLGKEKQVDKRRLELAAGMKSDHLMLVNVYDGWERARKFGKEARYIRENFLSTSVLHQLQIMRKQFADLLYDRKFINSRFHDAKEVNHNSHNLSLVKAVITAGLYPNVTRILKMPHGKRKGTLKAIVLPDRQKVLIHPKSVNGMERMFENNWLIYWEKLKSTKIYLYDTTMISNYPLLLFGEKLEYDPTEKIINIDGFVKVSCSEDVADVIQKLRIQLDELLEYKISHPGMTQWGINSKEGRFLSLVAQTLSNEKTESDDTNYNYDAGDTEEFEDEIY